MKKLVIGTAVIAGAAVAALPYANGIIMEKAFYSCVDEANRIYSDTEMGMSIDVVRYDRGFASTEIEWKINLGKLKGKTPIDSVIVIDRAKHGIASVTSTSSLAKNKWYTDAISNYTQGKDPLTLETEYKLLGDIISTMNIDAFTATIDGVETSIKPGSVRVKTDRSFKHFISDGYWEGLDIDNAIELSSLSTKANLEIVSSFIWKGSSSFSIKTMAVEENGQKVEVSNIQAGYSMDYDSAADRLQSDVSYTVDSVKTPESTIDNIALEIGIAGLDGTAYEDAMKIYMDLVGSLLETASAAGDDPEAIQEAVQAQMMGLGLQMMAVYEKFLKQGLELHLKRLNATLPEGTINGSVTLKLLKDVTMAQLLPVASTPELLFDYVHIDSRGSLPLSMASDSPMLVVPLYPGMPTGFFIEEGTELKHRGETKDGVFYLNGQEVEFP